MSTSDLHVDLVSRSLSGKRLDVIVSGSIGAVESVRFIRALRRLGATVVPWISEGARQFVTETSLAWAADHPVRSGFSGQHTHLAETDGCIVAPASVSFVGKIANGITDTHTAAVVTSHMAKGNPVILVPNAHDSLLKSAAAKRNIETLVKDGLQFIEPRMEEGKHKFPDPDSAARTCSHLILRKNKSVLITMGTTRGYVDDVRFLSNYSSGALGTRISEEMYGAGWDTLIVAGPCESKPRVFSEIVNVETTTEMHEAVKKIVAKGVDGSVALASVLDYEPIKLSGGKIRSGQEDLSIQLRPTAKIVSDIQVKSGPNVGFKLEVDATQTRLDEITKSYFDRYKFSLLVVNDKRDVSNTNHKALIYERDKLESPMAAHSKQEIAWAISDHASHLLELDMK